MTPPVRSSPVTDAFEERAARADDLARVTPSASDPLRFAAGLLRAQAALALDLVSAHRSDPLSGRLADDSPRILREPRAVFAFAARRGPDALRQEARARAAESDDIARTRLALFWSGDRGAAEDYLSRALLRPYLEVLRAQGLAPDRAHGSGRCPFCGGAALVACRRSGSDADGAARSLVCGLCGLEWSFLRIHCPACAEDSPEKLPAFKSDTHPAVRIEACETCRRYVKSIDLSIDARAVPEIDDLASLALDLWSIEQGFTRLEPGWAGL